MARPGILLVSADELRGKLALADDVPLSLQVVEAPLIEIASRDLRKRVAAGRSVRYLVPRAVEVYVEEKGLYREGKER
jgi:nicotinate-nucleotide adenylyltransferase